MCLVSRDDLVRHGDNFARHGVGHRLGKRLARKAAPDVHLLIELIAANLGNVIAPRVEEQRVQIALGAFDCGRLARTELAVDFEKRLLARAAGVLFERCVQERIFAKDLLDLCVGRNAEGAN